LQCSPVVSSTGVLRDLLDQVATCKWRNQSSWGDGTVSESPAIGVGITSYYVLCSGAQLRSNRGVGAWVGRGQPVVSEQALIS